MAHIAPDTWDAEGREDPAVASVPGMIDTPARRHRVRPYAGAIAVLWLLVLAVAGPLSGKLADVVESSQSAFLPDSAESTLALEVEKALAGADVFPTLVVYERTSGITDADRARVERDAARIARVEGVVAVLPAQPAKDGQALQVVAAVDGTDVEKLPVIVGEIRDGTDPKDGLGVWVTGIGGFSADQFEVFSSIDGPLLLATAGVVVLILLLVYRSPVLWLLPLVCAGAAFATSAAVIYGLARADLLTVDAQSQGILTVLVFGAGTDYALLLIARYREELHEFDRPWDAMRVALRGAVPAIVASAATVCLGLLCLLASDLASNRGLGPVAAIGVVSAALTMTTLLPALLLLIGRRAFWPRVPQADHLGLTEHGVWGRISEHVGAHPRRVSLLSAGALLVLAAGATQLQASGIGSSDFFTERNESVVGQEVIERHYDAGSGRPVTVVAPVAQADAVKRVVDADRDVVGSAFATTDPTDPAAPRNERDGLVLLNATLSVSGDGTDAQAVVDRLRDEVDEVSRDVLVGGSTAINLDLQRASQRDNRVIIPLVLLVILVVLALLLRAVVAPLMLIGTVVLSYAATLGVCAIVFNEVFGFAGADSSFPLFAFVFLVALGIDYNIFLMSRVREETVETGSTRAGTLKGLAVTGGVITSAGVVLAATFGVLGVLPLVPLAQLGFAVAFGVLLDTIVVRSLLVPALTLQLDRRTWWPSALSRAGESAPAPRP